MFPKMPSRFDLGVPAGNSRLQLIDLLQGARLEQALGLPLVEGILHGRHSHLESLLRSPQGGCILNLKASLLNPKLNLCF